MGQITTNRGLRAFAITGLACLVLTGAARGQSGVKGWGSTVFDSGWSSETAFVEVAAGDGHTVARRSDGSVVAWGDNQYGQCDVPALPAGLTYVEVAAGVYHTVARRSDGSVVAWGLYQGQYNVPALSAGLIYVEVKAGGWYTLARRSDGSVVAWGDNGYGQCNVPVLPAGLTYVEVAAGTFHALARRSDGSVVAWGDNYNGQCDVPVLPVGLTYVEIAAGDAHSVARYVAAAVLSVGTSCGGAGAPVFSCNAPRIGQNVFLTLTSGSPNAAGFLYGGGIPPTPYPLGSGCELQVDLSSFVQFSPAMTDSTGTWRKGLLIPPNPNLVGVQAALQVALLSTSGPLGFDLSNGLIVTVGY